MNTSPLPLAFSSVVAALLFVTSAWCTARFDPSVSGLASLLLQHTSVIGAFLALQAGCRRRAFRAALVLALLLYVALFALDCMSLVTFSVRARGVAGLLVLGDDPASVLGQAQASRADLLLFVVLMLTGLVLLGGLYRWLPRSSHAASWSAALLGAPVLLLATFLGEQAHSRQSDEYLWRGTALPGYYRVFSSSPQQLTVELPAAVPEADFDAAVKRVHVAANPKNVVFVLLESFRSDVVGELLTPRLSALIDDGLFLVNAYTESALTARAWNVLLLNRPAYSVFQDIAALAATGSEPTQGAFPLRVLKSAGYRILISMPSEFSYLGFQQRIMGAGGLVDEFFSSYPGHNRARAAADDRAVDKITEWLEDPSLAEPFVILTHLDSTHFKYFFPEESAVVRPYAAAVSPHTVVSQAGLDLLFNRYKNAVHHVDYNVGRILDALERTGRRSDTAIVIVSDHGESFQVGAVAHVSVTESTKCIPAWLVLPDVKPAIVTRWTSQRDVFPTLFDYLDIGGLDEKILLGESLLDSGQESMSALTFRGDMQQAHLTFPLLAIVFEVARQLDESMTFSPIAVLDPSGRPITQWRALLDRVPWQSELQAHLSRRTGAVSG